MLGIHDFSLFVAAAAVVIVTPGQDTLYIVGRSLAQGRRAGFASVLGIASGTLVHTLAAALGLSAVLATSSHAFTIVKFAGAAYLVWLGLQMLLVRRAPAAQPREFGVDTLRKVYLQGIASNVLNPKVALFFLAFMPQFITQASTRKFLAFVVLGLSFVAMGAVWCCCLAWFASAAAAKLRGDQRLGTALSRGAGVLFVALGARLALSR